MVAVLCAVGRHHGGPGDGVAARLHRAVLGQAAGRQPGDERDGGDARKRAPVQVGQHQCLRPTSVRQTSIWLDRRPPGSTAWNLPEYTPRLTCAPDKTIHDTWHAEYRCALMTSAQPVNMADCVTQAVLSEGRRAAGEHRLGRRSSACQWRRRHDGQRADYIAGMMRTAVIFVTGRHVEIGQSRYN